MKRETFNLGFAALLNGYTYAAERVTPESQDVYWEMLHGIPDDAFNRGVRKCLASSKYFPSISELGEASLPTKLIPAPYDPHVYTPPREVTWDQQVKEIARKEIGKLPGEVGVRELANKMSVRR
jgi:hypothetical protein